MSNIKILILENSPVQADALAKMLRTMGYEVAGVASSGEKAIKLFEEKMPDLAMLDIRMPGPINGVEAGKIMMEIRRTPHIYLSAWADEHFDEASSTTPQAVFSKPYNERDLQRAIELAIRLYAQNDKPGTGEGEPGAVVFPSVIISRDCLWIKQRPDERERFFKLPVAEVKWIKSDNVYLEFHTEKRLIPLVITMKISKFFDAIQGREEYEGFVQVSRSYILHLNYMEGFTKTFDNLSMREQYHVPVSKGYRKAVEAAIKRYLDRNGS